MKIILRLCTVVFAVTMIIGLSGFNSADNNGAGVIEGFGCGLFDGYGGFVNTFDQDNISVVNHGGNTVLICHASGVPTPGVRYSVSDFPCGTPGGSTTNSYASVSADGESLLRCYIKKNQ